MPHCSNMQAPVHTNIGFKVFKWHRSYGSAHSKPCYWTGMWLTSPQLFESHCSRDCGTFAKDSQCPTHRQDPHLKTSQCS